ncbi:MAG: hypothetical protein IJM47_04505, partial [Synergistaceae bacterium]|nr:hypothetical protein [Synergistaceae bacterium]
IYLTKSLKYGASTTHLVTDYAFYDPSISVSIPLNHQTGLSAFPTTPSQVLTFFCHLMKLTA